MSCGVYQIRNTINGKIYIGSSKEIEERWKRHLKDLQDGRHHNIKLQRAFNKYGEAAFVFEVIELADPNCLLIREQSYLDNNKNGYNIGLHASGGDNLTNNPNREEIIKRKGEGPKKAKAAWTEEQWAAYKQKITGKGNPNYGKKWCKASREKMSKRRTGAKASAETKAKISAIIKDRWQNEEYRNKEIARRHGVGNPFYGKHHTEESKQKIRNKKIKPPLES
jgi:group I intron endonuclease